jgi:photosystem II stability/assembly factor-like uncharacterized protein
MHVEDVSPRRAATQITIDRNHQSVSGKALCVAMSADGQRLYLGGHSAVWRSDDGGLTWTHPERPQPPAGTTRVPGALLVPNVYDLIISPTNPDIVLAATGRDSRRPDPSGIYRSTDGARSWTRVYQFLSGSTVGTVASFAVAPDDPNLIFAGGQFAVGVSTDGGRTWSERVPQRSSNQAVWYVVVGPASAAGRHVYAVGSHVWHSTDGGETWSEDPVDLSLGSPADGLGQCSRSVCLHPTNPLVLYLARQAGELWRGDYSGADGTGGAEWVRFPAPRIDYSGTTASGTDYVVAHRAPDGRLYHIFSDRRTVHIADGVPDDESDWTRIDPDPIHVDPHGIAATPDFRWASAGGGGGRIAMVNDGGVNVSTNGAASWTFGDGLSTLGLVNAAVLPRSGRAPGICIQMGDNNGFFSANGGRNWRTQDYRGGDNDCTFADPRQPNRLIVFAPRFGPRPGPRAILLYTASEGAIPDGSWGSDDRKVIWGPPPPGGEGTSLWTAVSSFYGRGYRPLVLTLDGESPRPDGDFVTIVVSDLTDDATAKVLRTTAMSSITDPEDWVTTARAEGPGVKVFQQGPDLPSKDIDVVQASGGHDRPTLYVGDLGEGSSQRLWKWREGMSAWQQLVPGAESGAPAVARRFFVDPYRPNLLYVLDRDHVRRSEDGGTTWIVDTSLEQAITEDGAFPLDLSTEASFPQIILRDMHFDPAEPDYRFAVGPAGVFATTNGADWTHLLLSSAAGVRPGNAVYDRESDPCARMLYVSTSNRGLLRLGPLPPDWEVLPGQVTATEGRVTLLRVHDVGTGYGPPDDRLDAEVIVQLDSEPGRSFGLQLRENANEDAARGMLALLRDAFNHDRRMRLEFVRTGCTVGRIIRVIHP